MRVTIVTEAGRVGAEIQFRHRHYKEPLWLNFPAANRHHGPLQRQVQAYSRAELWIEGHKIAWGGTWCSTSDEFDLEVARTTAFTRLLAKTALSKDVRRQLWEGLRWNLERSEIMDRIARGKDGTDETAEREEGYPKESQIDEPEESKVGLLDASEGG